MDPQEAARVALGDLRRAALRWAMARPGPQPGGAADARHALEHAATRWAQTDLQAAADRGVPHTLAGPCPLCVADGREDAATAQGRPHMARYPCRALAARTGPATHAVCDRLSCPDYDIPRALAP